MRRTATETAAHRRARLLTEGGRRVDLLLEAADVAALQRLLHPRETITAALVRLIHEAAKAKRG